MYTCLNYAYVDILQATKARIHNVNNVTILDHVFDIQEWIAPHLDEIKYHTQPHIFLFKRNGSGKAAMYYKQWSHCDWEPSSDGCLLLKVILRTVYVCIYACRYACVTDLVY